MSKVFFFPGFIITRTSFSAFLFPTSFPLPDFRDMARSFNNFDARFDLAGGLIFWKSSSADAHCPAIIERTTNPTRSVLGCGPWVGSSSTTPSSRLTRLLSTLLLRCRSGWPSCASFFCDIHHGILVTRTGLNGLSINIIFLLYLQLFISQLHLDSFLVIVFIDRFPFLTTLSPSTPLGR